MLPNACSYVSRISTPEPRCAAGAKHILEGVLQPHLRKSKEILLPLRGHQDLEMLWIIVIEPKQQKVCILSVLSEVEAALVCGGPGCKEKR